MLQTRFLLLLLFGLLTSVLMLTSGCGRLSKEASDDNHPDIADMGDQGTRSPLNSLTPSSNLNTVSTSNVSF